MFIIDIMMAISNWLWGWPLLILTSAVAVYLSVRFKFFQFTRFGHAMKNTFGKIFDKGDGEGDISPFQAAARRWPPRLAWGTSPVYRWPSPPAALAPYSGCGPWPSWASS